MKKLSRDEMKNVMGGFYGGPGPGGDSVFTNYCYKFNSTGNSTSEKCVLKNSKVGDTYVSNCECSLTGATAC